MRKKSLLVLLTLAMLTMVFTACSGGGDKEAAKTNDKVGEVGKPVTLKIYNWGNLNDDEYQKFLVDPVTKKYPNITIEQIKRAKGSEPADLVAAGADFDLIITNDDTLNVFKDLGLLYDISPQVKKDNVDLSRFDPIGIDRSKLYGELVGLPFNISWNTMFYNKDIFDKFGIAYPKDDMTWDQLIALTKQLTRKDQDIQYKGLDPQSIYGMAGAIPLNLIDPVTGKSSIDNDQWRKVLTVYKDIVSIPGNQQVGTAFAQVVDGFLKTKTTAMILSNVMTLMEEATKNGFNWDIAKIPDFNPGKSLAGGQTTVLAISKISKHPDDVMKVINVLTSDEVQLQSAKTTARRSGLKSQAIKDAFGAEMPILKGKNVKSIFKSEPVPALPASIYLNDAKGVFNTKTKEFFTSSMDLNTFIRETTDEMNKKVDSVRK